MIYLDANEVGFFDISKGIVLPLLFVFLIELAYRDMLMEISKESVPEMQENLADSEGFTDFLEVVVIAGSIRALVLV